MSLKLICIIIYNECFDHVCSWNYNAYITILCKLCFQHQLHLYIISPCHGFTHSVPCFFVYGPADCWEPGEFGEPTTRGDTATGVSFFYVLSLSTQLWSRMGENFIFTQMARFLSFMALLLS